jgi:hypothetical protein
MRQTYESQADRDRETLVKMRIEEITGAALIKLPPRDSFDYAVTKKGLITGLVEIKCRTIPSTLHETYLIDVHKLRNAASYAAIHPDIDCRLWVQWTDVLGCIDMTIPHTEWMVGGRSDREDPQDISICSYIPIKEFQMY